MILSYLIQSRRKSVEHFLNGPLLENKRHTWEEVLYENVFVWSAIDVDTMSERSDTTVAGKRASSPRVSILNQNGADRGNASMLWIGKVGRSVTEGANASIKKISNGVWQFWKLDTERSCQIELPIERTLVHIPHRDRYSKRGLDE